MNPNSIRRSIRLLRHGQKDPKPREHMLSQRGIDEAREVGAKWAEDGFTTSITHIAITGWLRTAQTAMAIIEGAKTSINVPRLDLVDMVGPIGTPEYIGLSEAASTAATKHGKYGLTQIMDTSEEFVAMYAPFFANHVRAWAESLPENAQGVLIGHCPSLEMAVYDLTGNEAIAEQLSELGYIDIELMTDGNGNHTYRVVGATVAVKIGDATIMPVPQR